MSPEKSLKMAVLVLLLAGSVSLDFAVAQPPRTRPGAGERPAAETPDTRAPSDWPRIRQPGERRESGERSVTSRAAPSVEIAPRIAPRRSDWYLGVHTDRAPRGVRLSQIVRGSPASRFGLEVGDYILDVSGYVVGEYEGRYYPLAMAIEYGVDPSGWAELLVWNKRTYEAETLWVRFQRR